MFGNKDDQQPTDPTQATAQFQATNPVTPTVPEPIPSATLEGPAPTPDTNAPAAPSAPPPLPSGPSDAGSSKAIGVAPVMPDDLLALKQQALQQLSPLVSHLDQTPEERFRTTMMMIQATDDSGKIKDAYEAANQITDEKTRAQALLDIVNEINYFTQQHPENK